MAILKIALMGHPVLQRVAEPVEDPSDPAIARLAADMRETLEDIGANGLAAPQVYVSKRVVVYRVAPHQIPPGATMRPIPWRVLINPVITPLSEEKRPIWERCLSVPGLHGQVPRHTRIRLRAHQPDGAALDITAAGFHAMLLQHECDHLDGVLYPMRMADLSSFSYNMELGDRGFFVSRPLEEFVD